MEKGEEKRPPVLVNQPNEKVGWNEIRTQLIVAEVYRLQKMIEGLSSLNDDVEQMKKEQDKRIYALKLLEQSVGLMKERQDQLSWELRRLSISFLLLWIGFTFYVIGQQGYKPFWLNR